MAIVLYPILKIVTLCVCIYIGNGVICCSCIVIIRAVYYFLIIVRRRARYDIAPAATPT